MGSLSGLARMAVDDLRKEEVSVGSLKLRVVRPFPQEQLQEEVQNLELLIVLDRDASAGMGGSFTQKQQRASILWNLAPPLSTMSSDWEAVP